MKFKKGSKVVITLKGSPWENNTGVINGNDSGCFDTRVDFDSEWKDVLFNYKDMELYAKTYTEDQCHKKIELWKARLACVELKKPALNKWYRVSREGQESFLIFLTKIEAMKDDCGYGFTTEGEWSNGLGSAWHEYYEEATPEEVEEAMVREAKKRGFVFNNYAYHNEGTYEGDMYAWDSVLDSVHAEKIFYNGKWKESTPEYTMEEATKLIGHEFKIKK